MSRAPGPLAFKEAVNGAFSKSRGLAPRLSSAREFRMKPTHNQELLETLTSVKLLASYWAVLRRTTALTPLDAKTSK